MTAKFVFASIAALAMASPAHAQFKGLGKKLIDKAKDEVEDVLTKETEDPEKDDSADEEKPPELNETAAKDETETAVQQRTDHPVPRASEAGPVVTNFEISFSGSTAGATGDLNYPDGGTYSGRLIYDLSKHGKQIPVRFFDSPALFELDTPRGRFSCTPIHTKRSASNRVDLLETAIKITLSARSGEYACTEGAIAGLTPHQFTIRMNANFDPDDGALLEDLISGVSSNGSLAVHLRNEAANEQSYTSLSISKASFHPLGHGEIKAAEFDLKFPQDVVVEIMSDANKWEKSATPAAFEPQPEPKKASYADPVGEACARDSNLMSRLYDCGCIDAKAPHIRERLSDERFSKAKDEIQYRENQMRLAEERLAKETDPQRIENMKRSVERAKENLAELTERPDPMSHSPQLVGQYAYQSAECKIGEYFREKEKKDCLASASLLGVSDPEAHCACSANKAAELWLQSGNQQYRSTIATQVVAQARQACRG